MTTISWSDESRERAMVFIFLMFMAIACILCMAILIPGSRIV